MRVRETVADVLRNLLGYSGAVTDDTGPAEVPGWDSLAHLSIMEELEMRFQVRFTMDEMVRMTSVQAIRDALARHGVSDSAGGPPRREVLGA